MLARGSMLARVLTVVAMTVYAPACCCWAIETGAWLASLLPGGAASVCDGRPGCCGEDAQPVAPAEHDHHDHDHEDGCSCSRGSPRIAPTVLDPAGVAKPLVQVAVLDTAALPPYWCASASGRWAGEAAPHPAPTLLRLRCALTI